MLSIFYANDFLIWYHQSSLEGQVPRPMHTLVGQLPATPATPATPAQEIVKTYVKLSAYLFAFPFHYTILRFHMHHLFCWLLIQGKFLFLWKACRYLPSYLHTC